MGVPEEIRRVARPVNTVVIDNGIDGPKRYAVRERSSVKYVSGGNPQPQNGKVIGHICDGKFIPVQSAPVELLPEMLSYGAAAFAHSVSDDLLSDLLDVFPIKDAFTIITIATLRVIRPGIVSNRLATHYNRTFVCRYYPGVALSQNTVSTFLDRLGRNGSGRRNFYQHRADAVIAEHHVAIDGMLKQDNSTVNDLSAFSYKARKRGCREISVLYAYDIEAMEPICAEVFPGNCIDASSYVTFIRDNNISKGIIVADKGFPPSQIKNELKERPDLHFLTPIKRNDKRIADNDMLSFDGVLNGIGEQVLYKKCRIKGGRFLYSFMAESKASAEAAGYIDRRRKNKDFSAEEYSKKHNLFGVIVFESDLDLDPTTVYRCYDERWILELVFDRYKNDECLDKTTVQGDFSVMGSEFIDFISTVMTCRMLRRARDCGLMNTMSYGDLMSDLNEAWRRTDGPEEPSSDDGYWVHTLKEHLKELEALGLSKPVPKPAPRKRGRPKKVQDQETNKPKRPRGRPRKDS